MIPSTDLHQFYVHNDVYFAHLPLNYVDGVILEMAIPRMSYEQLAEFLEEKCGCYFQGLYYQVPSQDLEKGLVRVSDDRSTSYMFDVEETFGRINLYLDHLDMNLLEYLSQAITYDMDDLVSKKIGPPKKRYCNDFSVDEIVDWAEMEVETQGVEARNSNTKGVEARNSTIEGVEARTRTKDKGKEMVSEDASDVVETRRCIVEVDTEIEYKSDDESDYQLDKSVDYLSPGEDELIELRNRMNANRKEKAKAKDKPDSRINEPNEENCLPADNVRGETFKKHDIYMNELLKSLKTADKDGIIEDPFIFVEKHMERYPMYDETTHWRLRKPKVKADTTFMFIFQGLIEVVKDVMPNAEHRQCVGNTKSVGHFQSCNKIPKESFDEGLLPLMSNEVYIETGVLLVERHMMERMMSMGKGKKRMSDEFEFKKLFATIDYEFGLENSTQDSLELANDVQAEQGMEEHLYDEFNGVIYDTDDDASISGKVGDLETWLGDEEQGAIEGKGVVDLFDELDGRDVVPHEVVNEKMTERAEEGVDRDEVEHVC
ncbi:hypothetical protein Tco_0433241 [Tanacetum coccineum]